MQDDGVSQGESFDDADDNAIMVPIEWHIPETMVPRLGTNVVVQNVGGAHLVSFFELIPPIILGDPAERHEQMRHLDKVRAVCIAQVLLTDQRLAEVIRVLQEHQARHEGGVTEEEG